MQMPPEGARSGSARNGNFNALEHRVGSAQGADAAGGGRAAAGASPPFASVLAFPVSSGTATSTSSTASPDTHALRMYGESEKTVWNSWA